MLTCLHKHCLTLDLTDSAKSLKIHHLMKTLLQLKKEGKRSPYLVNKNSDCKEINDMQQDWHNIVQKLLYYTGNQKEAAAGSALYSTVDTSKKKQHVSGKIDNIIIILLKITLVPLPGKHYCQCHCTTVSYRTPERSSSWQCFILNSRHQQEKTACFR